MLGQFFFAGWLLMAVMMLFLWLFQRRHGDAGIVDVGWSYGIGLLALFYVVTLPQANARSWLLLFLALLWSVRLGTYLLLDRIVGKPEDGRYQSLRQSWGRQFQFKLFFFYQLQGAADSLLTIPFLLCLFHLSGPLGLWDLLAALIVLASVAGETTADLQLARFRRNPANKGKTCREGLWRFSRHPNYFFEWLHWMAYPVMAVPLLGVGQYFLWAATFFSALTILWLVLKVTGIPPTEAQALRSRGDDYRRYQQETSAFFPWFPKTSQSS